MWEASLLVGHLGLAFGTSSLSEWLCVLPWVGHQASNQPVNARDGCFASLFSRFAF